MSRAFIGRDREQAELSAGLRDAVGGDGRVFLVAGGPGIGKTALIDQVASNAGQSGARVLWGRCWEGGGAPPYLPWAQIISALTGGWDDDTLRSRAGPGFPHLAGLASELAERTVAMALSPVASPTARYQLFDATARLLRNASAAQPLMLVLDDLHAADMSSLLLRFLARDVQTARLFVVGAFRDVDAALSQDAADLLGEVGREGHLLHLGGLDRDEVNALVTDLSGVPPRDATVSAIFGATEGNPLFVREVVRLMAPGDTPKRAGGFDVPIPETVRAVIRRRLTALSGDAVQVVSVAAVVGRDFDLPLVAQSCDLPGGRVLRALGDAASLDVVAETPGTVGHYRFTHPLLQEVIYEQLPIPARVQLHRRIGAAIEDRSGSGSGPHLAELAHHFAKGADAGTAVKALDYARRAGDRAMATLAYEEAAAEYRRALEVLELTGKDDARRCDLLLLLGEALARAGAYHKARTVYLRAAEMARARSSPERLARAALGYGEPRVEGALVDRRLIALLREALDSLASDDSPLRVRLLARMALELTFSDESGLRESLSRDAVDMARRLDDRSALGSALRARWAAVWAPDRLDERAAVSDEIVQVARDTGDLEHELAGLALRASSAIECGRFHAAEIDIAAHARLVDELRMPIHQSASATMRAMQALVRGSFEEGERLADHALSLQAARTTTQVAHQHTHALIRWEQGRLREMCGAWRRLVDTFPHVPFARAWLALADAEDGRHEDARAGLRSAVEGMARPPRDGLWMPALAVAALVVARLDDDEAAGDLYPALLPYAERFIVFAVPEPVMCLGSASFSLALLATTRTQWDDAERHFEAALHAHGHAGASALLASTRYEYARMLSRRGRSRDRGRAAGLLEQALATARTSGMARLEQQAERLVDLTAGEAIPAHGTGTATSGPSAAGDSVFHREGDYWTISYDGSLVRLRDSKGMRYLARLLTAPGQELHAIDLEMGEHATQRPVPRRMAGARPAELGTRHDLGDAGELLDARAKAAYKARLDDLQREVDEAERFNDPARAATARQERDFLVDELARAVGLGGRDRKAAAHAERARLNVTRAIRAALANVGRANPSLGQHLSSTIRTGRYCAYTPDPRAPVTWRL